MHVCQFLCSWWVHPPIVDPNTHPSQCFRGCCTPIRVMACKADLYSIIITKQLYTCKYTATDCAIVTLAEDRGWIQDYSALDSTPCTPLLQNSGENTERCATQCCVFAEPVGKYIYIHVSFVPASTCMKTTTTSLGVGFSVVGTQ